MLTSEQQSALVQWKNLLVEAGLDRVLMCDAASEPPQLEERFRALAHLFGEGRGVARRDLLACAPEELLSTVETLGLVNRIGDRVAPACHIVFHLGLWLFCERKMSSSTMLYYGKDSIELSRMLMGATGSVLDLGSGVGTQALVCARTAARVTAVEIEPQAARLFWINAALNELSDKLELIIGDLLEPVAGRRFDVIVCNPPYMPVPPGVRYPIVAGGGGDGLELVRRLMAGLPEVLAPGGRCAVVGGVLGDCEGPDLAAFKKMAADSSLAMILHCVSRDELEGKILKKFADMALEGGDEDVEQAFRTHFANLNATHFYGYLLNAVLAPHPSVCAIYNDGISSHVQVVPFP